LELQGLTGLRPRSALGLALAILTLAPAAAGAADTSTTALSPTTGLSPTTAVTTQAIPSTPVLVTNPTKPPPGFRLNAETVRNIAAADPTVVAELRHHHHLVPYEYTKGPGNWQVSWFTPPGGHTPQKEMIQVYVSDASGKVTQAWTGFQVAWTMARGYPGAFGRQVNALYVWLPMCALFLLPFLPWRRRPTLLHLDLLVLLAFSVSLAFFNHADLGMSVPLVYPCLLYLFVRMLLLAFGRGRPREPLRVLVPTTWLAIGLIFLIGFRIGLNVTNSNVIDVGYAGVIGANKILYGDKLYGGWPPDNPAGDTYGPINYYAYVPSTVIFGWSGVWDNLPAAHAASIAFDLLTMLGLFLLGRMIRGPTTGVVLAYLWAAYPFTLFALSSNSNDALVALFIVLALLVLRWAPARGVAGAFAGLTKFAPLALGPLFLRGIGSPPTRRQVVRYCIAYGLALLVPLLPVLLSGDFAAFWRDTISYQFGRPAPFSIWGLWGGLTAEQRLVEGATIALAIAVMVVPRRRTMMEVAALGAAVIIALQLCLTYWFYLYIPWFFPLVIIALIASYPALGAARTAVETAAGAEPAGVAPGAQAQMSTP
jgi:hypothetical protein